MIYRKKEMKETERTLVEKIVKVKEYLDNADAILIGGGAGLSVAAGLEYSGKRFTENFADYIERYGMEDMYSAGFYPFATEEDKWGYWSRHIFINRIQPSAKKLYKDILELIGNKEYFVITTNVDAQFYKAGFKEEKIWAVQGDYGKIQCATACHDVLYDDEEMVKQMVQLQRNCKVPSHTLPRCPECGGKMEINIRKDFYFVQDKAWYKAAEHYEAFIKEYQKKKIVFLELGIGFNTPTIIRFPFEKMTYQFPDARLVRINLSNPEISKEIGNKGISIGNDIAQVIEMLKGNE